LSQESSAAGFSLRRAMLPQAAHESSVSDTIHLPITFRHLYLSCPRAINSTQIYSMFHRARCNITRVHQSYVKEALQPSPNVLPSDPFKKVS